MLQTAFNICTAVCVHAQKERRWLKIRLIFLLGPISTEIMETLINDGIYLEFTRQAEWDSCKQILMFPTELVVQNHSQQGGLGPSSPKVSWAA